MNKIEFSLSVYVYRYANTQSLYKYTYLKILVYAHTSISGLSNWVQIYRSLYTFIVTEGQGKYAVVQRHCLPTNLSLLVLNIRKSLNPAMKNNA